MQTNKYNQGAILLLKYGSFVNTLIGATSNNIYIGKTIGKYHFHISKKKQMFCLFNTFFYICEVTGQK